MRPLPLVGTLLVVLGLAPGLRAQRSDTLALSLPDALTRALSLSEEMRTARAQIDITDAQIGVARAGALPALRVNGFGMIPLAIGEGAEERAPMARAVIGGLITSTLLTLLVVPVMYTLLDDATAWARGRRERASLPPDAVSVLEPAGD